MTPSIYVLWKRLGLSLTLAILLLMQRSVVASIVSPPPLNPATYSSPNGKFELHVDPTERDGAGEASYRLMEVPQERWSGKLPFTLQEAGVTDSGFVAGYAYSEGRHPAHEGDFVVAVIDPLGKVLLREATPRKPSRFLHAGADPAANGFFIDEPNDRFVVRVGDPDINRGQEIWWVYKLSTAKAESKIIPARNLDNPTSARMILAARPLPGTPLTLVHWWRYDMNQRASTVGAIYALVDLEGRPVWTTELPVDYEIPGNEEAEDQLRALIRHSGGIVKFDSSDGFDILFAKEAQQVHFAVERDDDGDWSVSETSRAPYQLVPPAPAALRIPNVNWKDLGPVELKPSVKSVDSPIRDVRRIVFDGQGRIAFLRAEKAAAESTFVLIDSEGKVLHEAPLPTDLPEDFSWNGLCAVGGDRYVVAASGFDDKTSAKAWWVDAKGRTITPITGFSCPVVARLVGFSDGGFVAFGQVHQKYTIEDQVRGYDPQGNMIWSHSTEYGEKPGSGFSGADDLARTSRDEIAVLETVVETLSFFDRQGKPLREVELARTWKRKPNYASEIAIGPNGGLIVNDFQGRSPFVLTDADGKEVAALTPKYEDGREVDATECVQAAPDGRLWTCDGHCILRLNERGIVDRILGKPPQASELGRIRGIAISKDGRIHAVDERTGSIHVFDATGAFLHTCELKPNEFDATSTFACIATSNDGDVYLGLGGEFEGSRESRKFAHFSADGQRQADVTWPGRECYLQPGTNNVLADRFESVGLFDSSGKRLRQIERQPDGKWLLYLRGLAFAADGRFAVATDRTISIFNAAGDPERVFELPGSLGWMSGFCFDGKNLFVCCALGIVIFDEQGRPVAKFEPPRPRFVNEPYWRAFSVAEGREVLVFEANSSTLHRYRFDEAAAGEK